MGYGNMCARFFVLIQGLLQTRHIHKEHCGHNFLTHTVDGTVFQCPLP